jgi:hypothetical protein
MAVNESNNPDAIPINVDYNNRYQLNACEHYSSNYIPDLIERPFAKKEKKEKRKREKNNYKSTSFSSSFRASSHCATF